MTEREKMIEAINSVQAYGIMSNAFGGDLPVTNEMLADALIAAGMKFDAISEREYQGYCAYKIIEPQINGCFDRERALKGQLAVVYRALLNMTKKYCVAERKIATTKDGWFSCGEVQLALLAHEAIRDAEKELAEEKR